MREVVAHDIFELLGLPPDAPPARVRAAYADLAFRALPGSDGDAVSRLQQVTPAFRAWAAAHPEPAPALVDRETRAIFELMGNFFGAPPARRGADRYHQLVIAYADARDGCTIAVELPHRAHCQRCRGSGAEYGDLFPCTSCRQTGHRVVQGGVTACRECGGRGWYANVACESCEHGLVDVTGTVMITIPAGVTSGHVVRVDGRGDDAFRARPGDLYVTIEVDAVGVLVRRDDDVILETLVTRRHQLLGGTLEVLTLDGPTKIRVPRGVRDGDTLTLPGRGHLRVASSSGDPYRGGPARGDQIVVFRRR